MSETPTYIKFSKKWAVFVEAVRSLWRSELENKNRPNLIYYEELSDKALDAISEAGFVNEVQNNWLKLGESERGKFVAELYLLELEGFSNGVNTLSNIETTKTREFSKSDLLKKLIFLFLSRTCCLIFQWKVAGILISILSFPRYSLNTAT